MGDHSAADWTARQIRRNMARLFWISATLKWPRIMRRRSNRVR